MHVKTKNRHFPALGCPSLEFIALALALVVVFTPDPNTVHLIKVQEVFLLCFWGVAILSLLIAWKWERLGGFISIITMVVRELVYVLVYREWTVKFLLVWALVIPPAVMFLLIGHFTKQTQLIDQ